MVGHYVFMLLALPAGLEGGSGYNQLIFHAGYELPSNEYNVNPPIVHLPFVFEEYPNQEILLPRLK